MSFPIWALGLVLALIAPLVVRGLANAFDARARKRTEASIARARR
jgi:hypothetical protein